MSRLTAPPGPRQASGPRAGSGRRADGGARRPGHVTAPGVASREIARKDVATPQPEPLDAAPELEQSDAAVPPASAPAGGLSGLQLLLDQLDALLRDPTLARALSAFTARLAAGVRGLGAASAQAAKRLVAALARLRLPFLRPVLLALLAVALPLAVLALLASGDDEPSGGSAGDGPAQVAGAGSLGGAGMPDLQSGPAKVAPVNVALVLDRTYDAPARRRELRALGTWLAENHAAGTRVTVIDARTARASAPLRGSDLSAASVTRARPSTTAAIRSAFRRHKGRRLVVALGSSAPSTTASTLSIATDRDASAAAGVPLRRGRRSRATIDDRRPEALAGSVARAVMAISDQRERR